MMKKHYTFIITKGIDEYFIATVPELPGVITQAKNVEDLFPRVKEAIEVYLEAIEDEKMEKQEELQFIGVYQIEVEVV
jgi:predicted RNase H-like HicB family nuclease